MDRINKIAEEERSASGKPILATIKVQGSFNRSNVNRVMKWVRRMEEDLNSAPGTSHGWISVIPSFGDSDSAVKQMKLQFRSSIPREILTGKTRGEGDTFMEVALIDASTGNVVCDGPEASASVEIVLLEGKFDASDGDVWMTDEFDRSIVNDMKGKKPLVSENELLIKLRRGVGVFRDIRFRNDAKLGEYRLGAKMVDSDHRDRVMEAVSNGFKLKNYRCQYTMKHNVPSLTDEVFRLENIGKRSTKCLQEYKIYTVEDFLIQIMRDSKWLKEILKFGTNQWKRTVDNARACMDKKVYCYVDVQKKKGIVFDVCGEVLGLHLNNQYTPKHTFSDNHEAEAQELKESAVQHWEDVKSRDDENLGQEYLNACLSDRPAPVAVNMPVLDLPAYDPSNTETLNITGESCSGLNVAPQRNNLGTNSTDFGTDDVELADLSFQNSLDTFLNPQAINIPESLEDVVRIFDKWERADGPTKEVRADEQISAARAAAVEFSYRSFSLERMRSALNSVGAENLDPFVQHIPCPLQIPEVQYLHRGHLPTRWRRLLCVSRFFSVTKKVSIRFCKTKKQRVH